MSYVPLPAGGCRPGVLLGQDYPWAENRDLKFLNTNHDYLWIGTTSLGLASTCGISLPSVKLEGLRPPKADCLRAYTSNPCHPARFMSRRDNCDDDHVSARVKDKG